MRRKISESEKEEIDCIVAAVINHFDEYCNKIDIKEDVCLHYELLVCAVASWIFDEKRHTEFHPCKVIMPYKRASYFLYWFVRVKPIHILTQDCAIDSDTVLINETFAVIFVCKILEVKITSPLLNEFVYMLRYRDIHPESLFITMQLLQQT